MPALTATQSIVTVFAYGLHDDAEDVSTVIVAGDHMLNPDRFFEMCLAAVNEMDREDDEALIDEDDYDAEVGEFDRASFEDEFRWTMYTTVIFNVA